MIHDFSLSAASMAKIEAVGIGFDRDLVDFGEHRVLMPGRRPEGRPGAILEVEIERDVKTGDRPPSSLLFSGSMVTVGREVVASHFDKGKCSLQPGQRITRKRA